MLSKSKQIPAFHLLKVAVIFVALPCPAQTGADDRAFAVQTLMQMAGPVLSALADGK